MKYVGILVGLIIANYGYQLFTTHDWGTATERSWFQAVAIFTVWCTLAITPQP